MRLTRKLLTPILIFISITLIGLFTYFSITAVRQFDESEANHLEDIHKEFLTEIKTKEDLAIALAYEVANNPEIQAAFAARDRERLAALTLPSYQVIDAQFDIPQYQFHLSPATSFLRLHSLDQYGDDLSSFRQTVLIANQEKRAVSGIEIGRGGLGIRGVVPVTYQGRHIGTVEFGPNVDLTLLEALHTKSGANLQILLERNAAEIATFTGVEGKSQGPIDSLILQASTLETVFFGPITNYEQALAGNATLEHFDYQGHSYAVLTAPLYDFSGKVIGVVDIISDHTAVAQQQTRQVMFYIGILVVMLLTIGFGFSFLASRTLTPISDLTITSKAIAEGDLTKRATIQSNDEIGVLADAFNTMTSQLQNALQDMEKRVEMRTKALSTSAEVSQRLSSATDPQRLAVEVVEQVQAAFKYYHAHIYFMDEESGDLIMAGGTGDAGAAMLARGHKIPHGRGLVGRAAATNAPVLVPDVSKAEGWLPNPLLPDTRSEVAIPISSGRQVLGVLDVQQNTVNGLDQEDVRLLQSLAGQVAISLQNARSYEQSKSQAELETLANTIGQKIQRANTVEETLQTAIRELGLALGATRVKAAISARNNSDNKN